MVSAGPALGVLSLVVAEANPVPKPNAGPVFADWGLFVDGAGIAISLVGAAPVLACCEKFGVVPLAAEGKENAGALEPKLKRGADAFSAAAAGGAAIAISLALVLPAKRVGAEVLLLEPGTLAVKSTLRELG